MNNFHRPVVVVVEGRFNIMLLFANSLRYFINYFKTYRTKARVNVESLLKAIRRSSAALIACLGWRESLLKLFSILNEHFSTCTEPRYAID